MMQLPHRYRLALLGLLTIIPSHAGYLSWDKPIHDFGRLDRFQPLTHSFACTNKGPTAIVIRRIDSPCGCLSTQPPGDTILPGHRGGITVTFNTGEKDGPVDALILVTADSGTDSLRLRAEILRRVSVEPPELDFRRIFRGDTVSMTATILWERPETPTFDTATWGPDIYAIRMEKGGKRFVMRAWIAPKADRGAFADTIRLLTGSPSWPILTVPVRGEIMGRLFPEPAYMDFGNISASARNNAMVTLRSRKRKAYDITRIESEPRFLLVSISRNRDRDWSAHGLIYPGAPLGPFQGMIKLYVNGSKVPETSIPVTGTVTP